MFRRLKVLAVASLCLSGVVRADASEGQSIEDMVEKSIALRTHSIAAPYVDSDLQNRWWDFGADTIINTNKHIRLTQDRPSETGWLWSRMPLSVTNWQIDVEFKVDGKAHNLFGDGFAMWISKDRSKPGPVFGSVDYFHGLGIFFDTYANSRHAYQWPRVTAMMGNGKTAYDHEHDNAEHELAACSENFRRRDVATKARLTYIKGTTLKLELQTKELDKWTTCFETKSDLPPSPYIGFSALTGDVHDSHDIVAVNTYSLVLKEEHRQINLGTQASTAGAALKGQASKRAKPRKESGGAAGWFLFILKLIGVGAFVAFALAAYRTWKAQRRSKRAW